MASVNITWRDRNAYVGPFHVATVYWDDKPAKRLQCWRVTCKLPGGHILDNLSRQSSLDDGKKIAELAITNWFEKAMK